MVSKLQIWRIPNSSKISFGCNEEEPAGWKPACPYLNSMLIIHLGTGIFRIKQTKKTTLQPFVQINLAKYQIKKQLLCFFALYPSSLNDAYAPFPAL